MLTKRNVKIFFKDKGLFFTSLITPVILLVLYATFLAKVFKDSFLQAANGFEGATEAVVNGMVGGELFSSLLAVCCVTVAFCSNTLMASDKLSGARKDMLVTPVKKRTIAASYYAATLLTTLIVTYTATAACFLYIAAQGAWFFTAKNIFLILLDVLLLTMFGTAFSCIVNSFLSSQGQVSGVGTVISAGYGFICGAYMPISNFGETLQKILSCLPGTYGTALLRNHALADVFAEMSEKGFPAETVEAIKKGVDCSFSFFGRDVTVGAMYAVLAGSVVLLVAVYVLINILRKKRG